MGRLKGMKLYLAGQIDNSPDLGKGWRDEVKESLKREKFGVGILCPLNKPLEDGTEDDHEARKVWKASGEYDKLSQKMKRIRQVDLRLVDNADFLIVRIDKVPVMGTIEELMWANRQKRPTLIWVDKGCDSDWLYGMVNPTYIFYDLSSLMSYLVKVDQGLEDDNSRWIFIDWTKIDYI